MAYTLSKYEKETVILYNQSNDRVNITTYDPVLRRKLSDFAAKYPDLCQRLDKRKYPDYVEYEIDKDRLSGSWHRTVKNVREQLPNRPSACSTRPSKQRASTDQPAGAFSFAGQQKTILSMEVPL